MRLLFIVNTPGQAHTWKNIIIRLLAEGHEIKILARNYGSTPLVLEKSGLDHEVFQAGGARYMRLFRLAGHMLTCYRLSRSFCPNLVVGFGVDASVTGVLLRKPSVVFIDDDHTPHQNALASRLGSVIVTPDCFKGRLGTRHLKVKGYKELAYVHPKYFTPDESVFDELGLRHGERYVILRFNSWDAVHDIGTRGFSPHDKMRLVSELSEFARVFVSPEGTLPTYLERYRLKIPYERFHDALYHARMFVTDTGTSATEAAILGTPAIVFSRLGAGIGNFADLNRYGLLYWYPKAASAISKALELIVQPSLKEDWARKRQRMLAEKADVTEFMSELIGKFPESLQRMVSDPSEVR